MFNFNRYIIFLIKFGNYYIINLKKTKQIIELTLELMSKGVILTYELYNCDFDEGCNEILVENAQIVPTYYPYNLPYSLTDVSSISTF